MNSCMRAYSTVHQLLCHGGYCEIILSLARTLCRLLFTARPTARPLAGNPLRDVVHSRNPSKSTLAHEAVATVVLRKHHPIIRVGAGLIQFVYRSHLRLATEATRNRNAFSPFFPRVYLFEVPVPAAIVVLPQMCLVRRLCSCTRTAAPAYDDELGQCEQDLCEYPAGHSRAQQMRTSCLLPRVLALHRFPAQQRNNSSADDDDCFHYYQK